MKRRAMALFAAGTAVCGLVVGTTVSVASAAPAAVVHYKVVEKKFTVLSGATKTVTVKCPTGMRPVGGGAHYGQNSVPGANPAFVGISESDISLNRRGWTITAYTTSSQGPSAFTADVVCARW